MATFNQSFANDWRRSTSISRCYRYESGASDSYVSYTAPNRLGSLRIAKFNATTRFKKGRFSVNPFEGITFTGSSIKRDKPLKVNSGSSSYWPELDGHLAAFPRRYAGVGVDTMISGGIQYPSTNEVNNAITMAYVKLRKADLDVGVFLGELRETLAMLRNPLKGFRTIWNQFILSSRKHSRMTRTNLTDSLANQWLEYRYGIVPLMKDIEAIVKIVNDGLTSKRGKLLKCVRMPDPVTVPVYTKQLTYYDMIPGCVLTFNERMECTRGFAARIFYTYDEGPYQTFLRLGLDPSGILSTAWELTTLSFVWDWWINIGDWLQTLIDPLGVNVLGNSLSYKISYISTITGINAYYNNMSYPANSISDYKSVDTFSCFTRQVNLPKPALPPVNLEYNNWKHVVDSLALSWSRAIRPLLQKR